MSVLAVVLIACAVLLVLGAEWPRLAPRLRGGGEGRSTRDRRHHPARPHLRVVEPEHDDFAESVRRDLDRLPVIEEHDDRLR